MPHLAAPSASNNLADTMATLLGVWVGPDNTLGIRFGTRDKKGGSGLLLRVKPDQLTELIGALEDLRQNTK